MATIFDYLEEVQFDSFYDLPINELDVLALTEIGYLPFDDLVTFDFSLEKGIRLDNLAKLFFEKFKEGFPPFTMVNKYRLSLIEILSKSKRYKHIKLFGYVNDYDPEVQKQFSAVCYLYQPSHILTTFRGTDDSIIGWKEDFHMTYMPQVPAQRSATRYLTKLVCQLPVNYMLSGHSKGGNLAIYAASQVEPAIQPHIQRVFSYDAPGAHQSVIDSAGYRAIADKISSYIPQDSIVGMMLETPDHAQIVKSNYPGLAQHFTHSWQVEDKHFQPADELTSDSLQTDQTLKTWTATHTDEELKEFFDTFFGIFIQADIHHFGDITVETAQKVQKVIDNMQGLSPERKELLRRMAKMLLNTRIQIWKDSLPDLDFKLDKRLADLPFLKKIDFRPPLPPLEISTKAKNAEE